MQSLNRMDDSHWQLDWEVKEKWLAEQVGEGEKGAGREWMANSAHTHSSFMILTPSQVLKPRGALTQSLQ